MAQVQNQENLELFKDASRRLETFLAGHDIKLTHTLALEALTVAVGDRTYRRFRTLLEKPTAAPARPVEASAPEGWKEGEPRWEVHAVYRNNRQRFCDHYGAVDALDAAVACQVDRITARDGYSVDIACVIDRATGKVADTGFAGDSVIDTHSRALAEFLYVVKILIVDDGPDESVAAAAMLLEAMLDEGTARRIDRRDPETTSGWYGQRPVTVRSCGLSFTSDPVEALRVLTTFALSAVKEYAQRSGYTRWLRDIYHATALVDYWEAELRAYLPARESYDIAVGVNTSMPDTTNVDTRPVTWCDVVEASDYVRVPHASDVHVDSAGNFFVLE